MDQSKSSSTNMAAAAELLEKLQSLRQQQKSAVQQPTDIKNNVGSLNYVKLTDVNRIEDIEIPHQIITDLGTFEIPSFFRSKDVHYIVNYQNKLVKACWINRGLGLFLNALYLYKDNPEAASNQLDDALVCVENEVSRLVKNKVLTKRTGPGFMAMCQAHENVPRHAIVMSLRSWQTLCRFNRGWYSARKISLTRYPNLGPRTTVVLDVIIDQDPPAQTPAPQPLAPNSLGNRIPQLADMLRALEAEQAGVEVEELENEDCSGTMDAVYLNPLLLKEDLKGDGDGDLVYGKRLVRGRPIFRSMNMIRKPGEYQAELLDQMMRKSQRVQRTNLTAYLPQYFDDTPIDLATYFVRWLHHGASTMLADEEHPMHSAWDAIAEYGIGVVEFILDWRKGEDAETEILSMLEQLDSAMAEIKQAQEDGNWFARTVTSAQIKETQEFLETFDSLQQYLDLITQQYRRPQAEDKTAEEEASNELTNSTTVTN